MSTNPSQPRNPGATPPAGPNPSTSRVPMGWPQVPNPFAGATVPPSGVTPPPASAGGGANTVAGSTAGATTAGATAQTQQPAATNTTAGATAAVVANPTAITPVPSTCLTRSYGPTQRFHEFSERKKQITTADPNPPGYDSAADRVKGSIVNAIFTAPYAAAAALLTNGFTSLSLPAWNWLPSWAQGAGFGISAGEIALGLGASLAVGALSLINKEIRTIAKGALLTIPSFVNWTHEVGPQTCSYMEAFGLKLFPLREGVYLVPHISIFGRTFGFRAKANEMLVPGRTQSLAIGSSQGEAGPGADGDIPFAGLHITLEVDLEYQVGIMKKDSSAQPRKVRIDAQGSTIDVHDKFEIEQGDTQIMGLFYNRGWKTVENWYRTAFSEALEIIMEGWSDEERKDTQKLYMAIQAPANHEQSERRNRFNNAILDYLNEKSAQFNYGMAFTRTTVVNFGIPAEIMEKLKQQQVAEADKKVALSEAEAARTRGQGEADVVQLKLGAEGAGQRQLIQEIANSLPPGLSPAEQSAAIQHILTQRGQVAAAEAFARNLAVSAVYAPGGNSPSGGGGNAGAMDLYALSQLQAAQAQQPAAVNSGPAQGTVPPARPIPGKGGVSKP